MIVVNLDAYGRYASASALADFLELLALHGHSVKRAQLTDMITDNNWRIRSDENFAIPDQEQDFDQPEERVYGLVHERAEILRNRYPFLVDAADRLLYQAGQLGQPYLSLLALTIAHAYGIVGPAQPQHVFEQTVCDVLTSRGWMGVNFGGLRRDAANFEAAVLACGPPLGLNANADAAPHNTRAQDEGVDTILHIPWCVARPGRWTIVGQATCAMSHEWKTKIEDPSPHTWAPILGEILEPWVFLAAPHHAEPRHRHYLLDRSRRLLLDRLSLVPHKPAVSADEQGLLDAVIAENVEVP